MLQTLLKVVKINKIYIIKYYLINFIMFDKLSWIVIDYFYRCFYFILGVDYGACFFLVRTRIRQVYPLDWFYGGNSKFERNNYEKNIKSN